jgi:hypothetical protein
MTEDHPVSNRTIITEFVEKIEKEKNFDFV